MTFKDSSVIMDNDEGDILENIELQSNFKQRMKLKKQSEANGLKSDNNRILPHYDEEDEEEKVRKQQRIVLAAADDDEYGGINYMTKEEKLQGVRDKLNSKHLQKVSLDVKKVSHTHYNFNHLNFVIQEVGSDYLQADYAEPEQNSKQGFKKVRKGNILKKRNAEEDILEVLEKA